MKKTCLSLLIFLFALVSPAFPQATATAAEPSTFTLTLSGSAIPVAAPYGVSWVNVSSTQQVFLTWNSFVPGVKIPAAATAAASGGTIYTLVVTGTNLASPSSMSIGTNTPCGSLSVEDSAGTEFYLTACLSGAAPVPSLPFGDSFARANGALGAAYAVSPAGAITISANKATVAVGSSGQQIAYPVGLPGWTSSQFAQINGIQAGLSSRFGAAVNVVDAQNYYYVECTTFGGCSASAMVGGKQVFKGNFSLVPAAGNVVCLELVAGATLNLRVQGVYDKITIPVSGVTGVGVGAAYFGGQSTPTASITGLQTGNGKCP